MGQPRLERRYSVCDRAIFGHRPSDYSTSSHRTSDYASSGHRSSDYSSGNRLSDYSSWGQRPSDCSRWGSSDDDMEDSPTTNSFSPASDGSKLRGHSRYCLVASKQMVGVFLTVWVKSDLREHVRNMKVSCVGRGLMGYLGNKVKMVLILFLFSSY